VLQERSEEKSKLQTESQAALLLKEPKLYVSIICKGFCFQNSKSKKGIQSIKIPFIKEAACSSKFIIFWKFPVPREILLRLSLGLLIVYATDIKVNSPQNASPSLVAKIKINNGSSFGVLILKGYSKLNRQ
jgi:hypothetical protein